MKDALNNDAYLDPLIVGDAYELRPLRVPRIADNLQFVWNYAVVNKSNQRAEVHTDSYPGGVGMFLKLEAGFLEAAKALQEHFSKKERAKRPLIVKDAKPSSH